MQSYNKSTCINWCKIEKVLTFTHFCSKTTHISLSIILFILHMQNCYNYCVYLHDYCNFLSYYFKFFSLFSPLPYQTLSHPFFNVKKNKKKKKTKTKTTTNIHPLSQLTTSNIHPPSQITNHHHHHNQPITTSI